MSHPDPLSEWSAAVSTAFAHLSRPQATVLALWSYALLQLDTDQRSDLVSVLLRRKPVHAD